MSIETRQDSVPTDPPPDSETPTRRTGSRSATALAQAMHLTFRILRTVVALAFITYLARSSAFVVRQHELAYVLRFGKATGHARGPGLYFAFPYPIDHIVRIAAERVHTVHSNTFLPAKHTGRNSYSTALVPGRDGYLLTGDANILHADWVLRYTVEDPAVYAFGIRTIDRLLLNELDRAVIQNGSGFGVDAALRTEVETFRNSVQTVLSARIRELGLGVRLQRVDLLAIAPPVQVRDAFDDVVNAEQERSETISAAKTYAARTHNEALAAEARILAEAHAYKSRLLSSIAADVAYFEKIYEKFTEKPRVTLEPLLYATLRRVLLNVDEKYVVRNLAEGKQQLRILLSPTRERSRIHTGQ